MKNLSTLSYFIDRDLLVKTTTDEFDSKVLINPETYSIDLEFDLQDYCGDLPFENYSEIIHDEIIKEIQKYNKNLS